MARNATGPGAADRAEAREDAAEALAEAATSRRSATRLDVAQVVERIEAAPTGPKTVAVFDFDGTLINGYSAACSSSTSCAAAKWAHSTWPKQ